MGQARVGMNLIRPGSNEKINEYKTLGNWRIAKSRLYTGTIALANDIK